MTPFGTTMLLWATLFGLVLFADLPDAWTVARALVIGLSGLYSFRAPAAAPRRRVTKTASSERLGHRDHSAVARQRGKGRL